MPDADGYPTEEELERVRTWKAEGEFMSDGEEWLTYVESIWWAKDMLVSKDDEGRWYFSTGGWSGNEETIANMKKHPMLWFVMWESTRRGGHYTFLNINKAARIMVTPKA